MIDLRTTVMMKFVMPKRMAKSMFVETVLLLFLISSDSFVLSQNFRSILIERACTKRPELDFCSEFTTNAPSEQAEVVETTHIPLVLPPNPSTIPVPLETTTTATTTTTSRTTTTSTTTTTRQLSTSTAASVEFDEPSESQGNTTKEVEREKFGSLVRLPKPAKSSQEIVVDNVLKASGVATDEKIKVAQTADGNSTTLEDDKGVLVFVSEYCVVEREHFVKSCNGEIPAKEIPFCKSYPAACVSTNGVLPVISYCQRYYKHYPKHCKKQLVAKDALQFCFAFEQFCLPELAVLQAERMKPKSTLRRCEDVLPEARKVCNPFPNPKDTFNLLRCTHFLTNCKKFVDWL